MYVFHPKTGVRFAFPVHASFVASRVIPPAIFMQRHRVALYTTDCSILDLPGSLQGLFSQPEVTVLRYTSMLLFIALSNLVCLLLPALIAARVTPWEDPVNLGAHHVKRLSTPLKNLLHKRDAVLFASTPNAPDSLALNSTSVEFLETIPFEEEIDIPGLGRVLYFNVCWVFRSFRARPMG